MPRPRRAARPDLPQHALSDEGAARDHRPAPCHQPVDHRQTSRPAPSPRCRMARKRTVSCAAIASCCGSIREPILGASAATWRPPAADDDRSAARDRRDRRPPASCSPPVAQGREPRSPTPRPGRRRRAGLFALSAPVALTAAAFYLAHAAPRRFIAPSGCLPEPAGTPCVPGWTIWCSIPAPRREGLRWIEVGDPQLRKADKLQTSTR